LHVLLSRGQDAFEMRLAEPLTLKDLDYFQPPANLIDETKRLESLERPD
jgi:hypothetical protein